MTDQPTVETATIKLTPPHNGITASVPPVTIIAIILAAAVAVSLIAFAVGAVVALDSEHLTLSDSAVAFLTTTIGAIVGSLTTYLGIARGHEIATQNGAPNDHAT